MNISIGNTELANATTNDARWASIVARETVADGKFYYSVKTNGVYCSLSCPARQERTENVQVSPTCTAGAKTGSRQVNVCKPDQT